MDKQKYGCLVISDFNMNNFAGFLDNDDESPAVSTTVTPFGQVIQVLMDEKFEYSQRNCDFAVIWTLPQGVIKSFNDVLNYQNVSIDVIYQEVDEFSSLLLKASVRVNYLFVPLWVSPSYERGYGMLDMRNELGIANILMRMNLRLADNVAKASNIYLLNIQKWIENAGKYAFNPKMWYMGKIAFGNDVFKEAVKDIKSALIALSGNTRKLIILDLDDTLWGGIVGDAGWQNLNLGGHDPVGEAFADFQKGLKALTKRGIILAIVSKNEESVALEAINKNPGMILNINDFAGWKINWTDKAQNISELVSELNIGLQSAVFIDDNPVERARVRDVLPEVLVPEWPVNKMLYKKALLELSCFDVPSYTDEDVKRTKMYIDEKKRDNLKKEIGSIDEWLKTLDIRVKASGLEEHNKQRIVQLFNKTNQMNLSTRRMSESELLDWMNNGNRRLWAFNVEDKFGDSGLTGIISLDIQDDNRGQIVDFILSCRVMGRKIEETMLYTLIEYARQNGAISVYAKYIQTPKNKPCLDFWQKKSGFSSNGDSNMFEWNSQNSFVFPDAISLDII